MFAIVKALAFCNVLAAGLNTGGCLVVLTTILPALGEFSPIRSIEIHRAMLATRIDSVQRPAGLVAGTTAMFILLTRSLSPAALALYVLGLPGVAGIIITSRFFNVQSNKTVLSWPHGEVPDTYPIIRQRWNTIHGIRSVCSAWALVCFAAAAVVG